MAGFSKQDIFDAVWKTDAVPAPDTSTTREKNPTWQAVSVLSDIVNNVRAVRAQQAAQAAAIDALTRTVTELAANSADLDADALVARVQAAIDSIHIDITTSREG